MKKGFTLIEILVVIVILGVLITMVSGSFIASQKKSRDLKRKSDIVQIGKALELYYADRGRYPASSNGLIVGCGNPSAVLIECDWGDMWSNTATSPETVYMAAIPEDPKVNSYFYGSDASGTYYQIYARLENTDDMDIRKIDETIQTYTDTDCGPGECYYGVASSNTTPETGHALH